jgi:hypothetical protein
MIWFQPQFQEHIMLNVLLQEVWTVS